MISFKSFFTEFMLFRLDYIIASLSEQSKSK